MINNQTGVISDHGIPTAANFANRKGTPIYIDLDTGSAYFLSSSGIVTAIGTGGGSISYTPSGTGAVTTTVQDKLREVVSVKDFGAVGDNSNDDTTEIQAAIDSGARAIYFPPGDYVVSSSLNINRDRITLYGAGPGSTRIYRSADTFDIFNIASTSPTTTYINLVSIFNMEISGERIGTNTGGSGIRIKRATRVFLDNLLVTGGFGGILIEGSAQITISNIQLYSNQSFGGTFRSGSYLMKFTHYDTGSGLLMPSEIFVDNISARGNSANDYLDNCIVIEASDGIWISNGHIGFARNSSVKVLPTSTSAVVWGVNFSNIHFDGNSIQQYGVWYCPDVTYPDSQMKGHSYSNCQSTLALADGYYFNGFTGSQIQDVSINGGRVNLCAGWGMRIGNGTNFDIKGVTFFSNTTGSVIIENADFINLNCTYAASPIGVQLETNCTRINVDGVFSSITSQDIVVNSSNIDNTVNGETNASYTVASATDITLPLPHKFFYITGTTTIDTINSSDALLFREVVLWFEDACTVSDSAIKIAGAFTSTAGSTLSLMYSGSAWVETSRAIV